MGLSDGDGGSYSKVRYVVRISSALAIHLQERPHAAWSPTKPPPSCPHQMGSLHALAAARTGTSASSTACSERHFLESNVSAVRRSSSFPFRSRTNFSAPPARLPSD